MASTHDALTDFERTTATFDGDTKTVFRKGTGPAVIVMAEMPGITPAVATFARTVVDAGFSAVLPNLFGEPGAPPKIGRILTTITKACISKEFSAFARNQSSDAVRWLRALAAEEHARCCGRGVGAVGMCFTGALSMVVEPAVVAPVLSQPSLPFALSKGHRASIDITPADFATVKQRLIDEDMCVLGYRYSGDSLVPSERFAMLERELGDRFKGTVFTSTSKRDHSVLTEQLQQSAVDEVLAFFSERLR
jgi:dienelactone hydrolase